MSRKKKIKDKRRAEAKLRKEKKLEPSSPAKPEKTGKLPGKSKRDFSSMMERPALSQMKAPPGYVTLSMTHGLVEYAEPLMEYVEEGFIDEPDDAFQIAVELWNQDLPSDLSENLPRSTRSTIERKIARTLQMNSQEASEFLDKMIQRKKDLFPNDIQPDNPTFLCMKLEEEYHISAFDYNSLNLPKKAYTPEQEDHDLVHS